MSNDLCCGLRSVCNRKTANDLFDGLMHVSHTLDIMTWQQRTHYKPLTNKVSKSFFYHQKILFLSYLHFVWIFYCILCIIKYHKIFFYFTCILYGFSISIIKYHKIKKIHNHYIIIIYNKIKKKDCYNKCIIKILPIVERVLSPLIYDAWRTVSSFS